MQSWTVEDQEAGARLDRFLADRLAPLSRSRVRRLIEEGGVLVGTQSARASRVLASGERVTLTPSSPEPSIADPAPTADSGLVVRHADESIIVVAKPAGLVTHPGAAREASTVAGALLALFPDMRAAFAHEPDPAAPLGVPDPAARPNVELTLSREAELRPGIVHRLDRATTGLLVAARTPEAAKNLIEQFATRSVEKVYLAVVHGRPEQAEALIDAPIGRDPKQRQRMSAIAGGKPAVTRYRVVDATEYMSLVEAYPLTGRTHQIRVHLTAIGHPVVGDPVYGRRGDTGPLLLHAWKLAFAHPRTGLRARFTEPPPPEFLRAVAAAGLAPPEGIDSLIVEAGD